MVVLTDIVFNRGVMNGYYYGFGNVTALAIVAFFFPLFFFFFSAAKEHYTYISKFLL